MNDQVVEVVRHEDLASSDIEGLRGLFDSEYFVDFGRWDPEQPYGYAPHDVHVIARANRRIVGHVGWARREIAVGSRLVAVAGVGGVLATEAERGSGLGKLLMTCAAQTMREWHDDVDFGYLGCREEVVPFYVSCGWTQISATETFADRDGAPVTELPGPPILILPIRETASAWPHGDIDLRGRAW